MSTFIWLAFAMACGRKEEPAAAPETPAPGGTAGIPFDPATGTATVGGKVTFEGAPPKNAPIKMDADPVCKSLHKEPVFAEEVLAETGSLQNVFVYVKEGLEKYTFTPPAEPATIDQKGCHYTPHVGGMMVKQKLLIINSDPTLHNIHCWAEKNPQFNVGQPVKDMVSETKFAKPEVPLPVRCDVHKWMGAFIGVFDHPFHTVSKSGGSFELKVPPGNYEITAWHEKFGTKTMMVQVGDNDKKEVNFSFSANDKGTAD